jgi:hypothetical protein
VKAGIAMGVERAVTRWYLQRQSLLNEITRLEAQLMQAQALEQSSTASTPVLTSSEIAQQLARIQGNLKTLGPCPKPMMG